MLPRDWHILRNIRIQSKRVSMLKSRIALAMRVVQSTLQEKNSCML